jgi:hypothetical protein
MVVTSPKTIWTAVAAADTTCVIVVPAQRVRDVDRVRKEKWESPGVKVYACS